MTQKISLLAAVSKNLCIGKNNTLPWHIPEDFAFFKQYTMGKTIVMGRKTWDSLPKKPLPQRRNIVITRQDNLHLAGAECVSSLDDAIELLKDEDEIIIIGGEKIYKQFIEKATDLYLTEVDISIDGDAYFPNFDRNKWQVISHQSNRSIKNIDFAFVHYQRV
ncbi:MAG: dihydrofolate reductase [Neisseriaceae bacterium]|nr:dihydrofolate reductase [Neisseriaceae bacterium]